MKQTAVEWFYDQLTEVDYGCINKTFLQINNSLAGYKLRELFNEAKAMETKERLKHQLFIGKVTEILGFDKTVELLKQCNDEII